MRLPSSAVAISFLRALTRDVRGACRRLARDPRFTLAAVATLALCLGANLAIFAVVDGVLLRPLPFPDADRLVTIYNTYPGANVLRDESSIANYYERRGGLDGFAGVAVRRAGTAIVGEPGQSANVSLARVSPEFFDVLGVRLAAGRSFTEEETRIGGDQPAVLTDGLSRDLFGGDASAVGQLVRVDGVSRTVVGVLPPGFRYLSSEARLYLPVTSDDERRRAAARHWGSAVTMIGRLAPGVGIAQAQAAVDLHNARMVAGAPSPGEARMAEVGFRSVVTPLHEDHVASVRPVLLLVMTGAFLLLIVGAVNLVNLLLVRASTRERELAIRRAIGATRIDVARSTVVETLVLTLAGGLLGLGVGAAGVRLVGALGVADVPLGATVSFDARMVATAVAAALVTGLFFAVPVAWLNLRGRLTSALLADSRSGSTNRATLRLRHGFVVGQVVLVFVLLCGAGLLALSRWKRSGSPDAMREASDFGLRTAGAMPEAFGLRAAGFGARVGWDPPLRRWLHRYPEDSRVRRLVIAP